MMTTLLDLLSTLGQATWQPVWMPMLAWTLLVLPFWGLLERTNHLHPHAEYRLYQVLLAALPVGMLATALLDGRWASTPGMSNTGLPVVVMPPVEPTVQSSAAAPSLNWIHAVGLATVGAIGMSVVGLGRLALDGIALTRVRTDLNDGSPPADPQAIANRMADRLGLSRPVQICTPPDAAVPVTLAGLSPTVMLPPALLDRSDALQMTLTHEFTHIRRYDDLAHLVERTVGALFAAHPLVGRLTSRIAETREQACDAAVLADANTSPAAYARLLATFADERPPQIGTLTLSESPSSLTTRLRAMHSSVPNWLSSPFSLTAGLLAVGLAVTFGIVACSDSVAPSAVNSANSQSGSSPPSAKEKDLDDVFVEVEQRPDCGGVQALTEEIQYPDLARKAGIEGRVFVQFILNEKGNVTEPKVTKGVHKSLNQAALDAVQSLECKPGQHRGSPVKVKMALPVTFKLPKEESSSPGDTAQSPQSVVDNINFVFHALDSREQDRLRSTGSVFSRATRAALPFSYPDLVRKAGIGGTVEVTFTLGDAGDAQNPRITQSVHEAVDAAALRSVQNTTFTVRDAQAWSPAGKKISVQFESPSPADTS